MSCNKTTKMKDYRTGSKFKIGALSGYYKWSLFFFTLEEDMGFGVELGK